VGVWVCVWVGVYTKSKSSELSPLRRKLLRFAKQFPPPLRSNNRGSSIDLFRILPKWSLDGVTHRGLVSTSC
jgi:hypothetical protein